MRARPKIQNFCNTGESNIIWRTKYIITLRDWADEAEQENQELEESNSALQRFRIEDGMSAINEQNILRQEIKELEERAKVYGRHQFNRGSLKLDLVPFDDWKQALK